MCFLPQYFCQICRQFMRTGDRQYCESAERSRAKNKEPHCRPRIEATWKYKCENCFRKEQGWEPRKSDAEKKKDHEDADDDTSFEEDDEDDEDDKDDKKSKSKESSTKSQSRKYKF